MRKRGKAPQIDPSDMIVFAALAKSGGVRGAAAALGVPRSTVSRRLAQLESSLGAPLVVRTARRFALTELGAAFADRCGRLEDLVRESEELARRASDEPSGTLRVAAAPVLGEEILPALVAELARRHPRLSIELRLSVDYVDLRRDGVDLVLRARPLDDATDVFAARLGTSVTGCYAAPKYLAAHGTPKTLRDLEDHECILLGSQSPARWTFGDGEGERVVSVTGRLRLDSFRLARSLAAAGLGVLRATTVLCDPLVATGELVPLLERHWWRTPIYAAHAGPNPPPPKVRAFLELAREAVARALPSDGRPRWRSV